MISSVAAKSFTSESAQWTAVVQRDPAADDQFYYSVKTTGVYCRPSCGARLARRENVQFHPSCTDAEKAGFRPCKRCRPNQAPLSERQAAAITKACRRIEAAIETGEPIPPLDDLAQAAEMARFHFHRVFKAITSVTPKAYATEYRANRMRNELSRDSTVTVTDAIYQAGFQSNSRFYATSAKNLGMRPSKFRAGGQSATIRFATGECSLGSILVAASQKGVCTITLGDDPAELVHNLQDRFPNAELIGGDPQFEQWMAHVVGLVEAPRTEAQLDTCLPLDIRGTAFQQRVWQALCEIPLGATASYSAIAAKIGAPKSTRAVAQACAANALAVAIPCHRVVRSDGSISGYRWGVERKRALLDKEASA